MSADLVHVTEVIVVRWKSWLGTAKAVWYFGKPISENLLRQRRYDSQPGRNAAARICPDGICVQVRFPETAVEQRHERPTLLWTGSAIVAWACRIGFGHDIGHDTGRFSQADYLDRRRNLCTFFTQQSSCVRPATTVVTPDPCLNICRYSQSKVGEGIPQCWAPPNSHSCGSQTHISTAQWNLDIARLGSICNFGLPRR
ncbi:hypothetical protein CONLIGDRAFT_648947 [Coniochaeta ligniaria NRRL 30616]|uniref:Uncharacterized protein n=1 Tax=Coniochaeta ligniaria NRRL 30616 TaxID=1408157 RepID=A0A1J7IST0_9PEZI|nr:hypothetical protein CONLIGDRAFT_648947 [Coniochaeta ligniaria NRRL 30616]